MIKRKISKILGITLITLLTSGCTDTEKEVLAENKIEANKSVVISAVGDVMVHTSQLNAQKNDDGSYDFSNNFKYIENLIKDSDLSIANLETTININKNPSGYPSFNSPTELLSALKDTGFDIISTINNHSLDTGYSGVISTLEEIDKVGLKSIGTKKNESEKNYIIENINDINIGIASFSYGDIKPNNKYLNGIPSGKATNIVNVISSTDIDDAFSTIKNELDLMKNEGVDFIILNLHWGNEYEQHPSDYQRNLAQMLANEDVDIILGSHPHVVQPIEFVSSELNQSHETLVVYSMGNIISNQREEEMGFKESENGIIPIIKIEKDSNNIAKITEVSYVPTWVNKYNKDGKNHYEVVPLYEDLEIASTKYSAPKEDLEISFNNTTSLITDKRTKLYED